MIFRVNGHLWAPAMDDTVCPVWLDVYNRPADIRQIWVWTARGGMRGLSFGVFEGAMTLFFRCLRIALIEHRSEFSSPCLVEF